MKDTVIQYKKELNALIDSLSEEKLEHIITILLDAYRRDSQIFIAGNGGSAATANHFFCDFGKNAIQGEKRRFRIISLSSNIESVTAIGNDIAFDDVFRQQMLNLIRPEDVLIAVSASGNSLNIVNACEFAKEKNMHIITLTGFSGGTITKYAKEAIVFPSESYECIEDMQMAVLHMIVYVMKTHQHWFE